ncbi:pilus assembly protein TadG-related protein, partial [Cellulomonas bogoriensis]|uniref:pilus assembly protein TadG-related protein n=1 Tax=Cellulomonas bogoriensis TaxID=301388 RepID=UPI001E3D33FD
MSRCGHVTATGAGLAGDRGSGSVLVIALVAAVVVLAGGLAVLGQAGVVRAQAQSAADLAALGGA